MAGQADIEALLLGRMNTLAVGGVPVAWPNREFNPPDDGKYLQVRILPNRNTRLFLRGDAPVWRQGILQVSVFRPHNEGPSPATLLADTIAAHFHSDLWLYGDGFRVGITNTPDVGSAISDDRSWMVPVSVYYETFL